MRDILSLERDRYNTIDENEDPQNYQRIVNSKIKLAPSDAESLETYLTRIKIYQNIARETNWNTHVDNPYKTWHTHKNPMGCFMCQDTQFIQVLIQVLQLINDQHPSIHFKQS